MRRSSNRKKARREAARRMPQASHGSRSRGAPEPAALALASARKMVKQVFGTPEHQSVPEYRAWCGGAQPVPAQERRWAEGSLGDRLCSGPDVARARWAPSLLTANVPDPLMIILDPAQWSAATRVLVRAVVFDRLRVDHPAVNRLLNVLAPIAEAELAHNQALDLWYSSAWEEDPKPEFPAMDGPVFLLGGALGDATLAVVGEDPLNEVIGALTPALDGTVPGLEGRAVADVLTGGRAIPYMCELPDYVLKRMQRTFSVGGTLLELADANAVPARDILRVGLTILSAVTGLCRCDSVSILARAA